MINVLRRGQTSVQAISIQAGWRPEPDIVWIDLFRPNRDEELAVEAALCLQLPTVEEMEALEPSSRLYQEGGATFMTATLLAHGSEAAPHATPVTFVLAKGVLITLRYEDLRAFRIFGEHARCDEASPRAGPLLGLLDAVLERVARILDETEDRVAEVSAVIFKRPPGGNFRPLLTGLAQAQSVIALARTSLVSLGRLLSFAALAPEIADDREARAHLKTLQRDAQSLTEHTSHQGSHLGFLLDAALGLINIEQNGIIKFFSVVAVIFMPPTLIASIYGMNFDVMPELHWHAGYPMAVVAMVVAAVLPVLWFKRRGWL
ncbi:magnesium transporter CorA family protein [Phenylobacterium sp.]|jgi:magnesium transporter|uniref:magnesium transporter CorA family protein n=1 Tax=Phenylobacterium sp. TaxID=1871053 RepID=UPI0037CAB836